jgi:enoyl-CoA hydratase
VLAPALLETMSSSHITTERADSSLSIRLNRPEKFNALTREMILELQGMFANLQDQPDIRAVILTGTGEQAFCAGTDIVELTEVGNSTTHAREVSERGQALCDQIEACGVPVIAAVNGIAAGGGCELALACHLRLASENARFSLPETKLGVVPGYGGTQRLAREIGHGRAYEMMLTGRTISAAQALQFGLLNHVYAAADLLPRAAALAHEVAKLAPLAIRACLEAVTVGTQLPLAEGLALESKLFAALFATDDVREGTSAFLEKRKPVFKGK